MSWPSFEDLLGAYRKCRNRKKPSVHQTCFESKLGENLRQLHREIHSGRYAPSRSECFVVLKPKPREIFAAHFRDRVIHHLIVGELEPFWERKFIETSFACRKGMGPLRAIESLNSMVRKTGEGGQREVFALQLDIESFFGTIHRPTLTRLLLEHLPPIRHTHPNHGKRKRLRELVKLSYSHDPRHGARTISPPERMALIPAQKSWFGKAHDQGLPIGNLTSQFGSNAYLCGLDHWIVRTLQPEGYLRYMDDLLLLGTSREILQAWIEPIDSWLYEQRKQRMNPYKTKLGSLRSGIDYLGYHLQLAAEGGGIELRAPALKKWKWLESIRELEKTGISFPEAVHPLGFPTHPKELRKKLACVNSRLGFLGHAKTYKLRKTALDRMKASLAWIAPGETPWDPVTIKKDYRSIRLK